MSKGRVTEVYPNIYQIPGVNRSAHSYLVKGDRKNILIDAGLPNTTEHVINCLRDAGVEVRDVHLVLLTHEHIDHAGGILAFSGSAIVAAHRLAANKLVLKDEFALMNGAFSASVDGLNVDMLIDEGVSIDLGNYRLEILHTPGHCSGAICIYEPNHRLLFSGDTIMAKGVVGGVLGSGSPSDYIHTLRRLSALKITHMYPGHGKLSNTPEADIVQGLERIERLLKDTKRLFGAITHASQGFDQIFRSLHDLNFSDTGEPASRQTKPMPSPALMNDLGSSTDSPP